jgi:hypothetical protein
MSSEAALEMSPSGQTNCLFIVLFIQKFQNIPKNSPLLSFSFFSVFLDRVQVRLLRRFPFLLIALHF